VPCYAEQSRSATAAGDLSLDEAREQRISHSQRKGKGRRLLAGASGLGSMAQNPSFCLNSASFLIRTLPGSPAGALR
jgi:hypothetical protein